jgi:hypothetical protein
MDTARIDMPHWECIELVRAAGIGRLCIIESGCPVALPVNFRLDETSGSVRFVVRAAPESVIGRYEGPASLEVDHIDIAGGGAWSVIARGQLRRVLGGHELADPRPFVDVGRTQWMLLDSVTLGGRRFRVTRSQDSCWVEWQLGP